MIPQPRQTDEISQTLARIKAGVLALVCALIGGTGLFVMTVWLVIKDGPQAGQHLQLLSNYFVGYSVTWPGAFVGLLYGAMIGGVVGWAIGRIYNGVVNVLQR
ncbi:MAG: hypothetical protein JJE16_07705 [Nitrospiraceae bacterium]|nr:hypothetical protein [Nitrospiraceae bacterium]